MTSVITAHIPPLGFGIALALVLVAATGFAAHAEPMQAQFVGMVAQANSVVAQFSDSAFASPIFRDVENGLTAASSLGSVMGSFRASYGDSFDVHALAGYADLENKRLRENALAQRLWAARARMH